MFDSLKEEIKRPATAVAVGIAVISIVLGTAVSVLLYYKSIKEGRPLYQVQQVKVFDQGGVITNPNSYDSSLYVVDKSGKNIDGNVYAATIKFWNGGTDEVRRQDIREVFKVEINGEAKFVNTGIYSSTNRNRGKFGINDENIISWDHFDPEEGIIIRIIYASNSQQKISIVGYAANSASPEDVTNKQSYLNSNIKLYTVAFMLFAVIFAIFRGAYKAIRAEYGMRISFFISGALEYWILAPFFAAQIIYSIADFIPFTPNPPF